MLAKALLSGASGQLRNLATTGGNLLQRTRCPYFQDVTKPCNKREPGTGCPAREGDHRNLAIIGHSERVRRDPPVRHGRGARGARRLVRVLGRDGERRVPLGDFHRLPGDEPQRDTVARPGDLITAVVVPPLPMARSAYRKVRERASFAFALVSVAAALDVRDGTSATSGSRWAASPTSRGGPGGRRRRCAARPAAGESFARAADAELAAAEPLRDNAYKVPLARNLIVRTLARAGGGGDDRAVEVVGTPTARGPREGHRRGPLRLRVPAGRRRVPARAVQAEAGRGEIVSVDAEAARGRPGVLAVLSCENAPRLARGRRRAGRLPDPEVAYRGQFVAAVVAESRRPRGRRPGSCASSTRPRTAGRPAPRRPPRPLQAGERQPGLPPDTEQGDVEAALKGADVRVDATYTTPAEHNNPMEPHATTAHWGEDGRSPSTTPRRAPPPAADARQAVRARTGAGAGRRPPRGRRVRGEGHAPAQRRCWPPWPRARWAAR